MEDILKQLSKEVVTPKFGAIKNSCSAALTILQNEEALQMTEAWQLREICLEPLQMALESRAKKLSYHSLAGIQQIFRDERFHSSLEAGEENKWLPVQVLNTLYMTPTLPEDIQVEIMKLLLNMTLTTAWCMNARIITKISQLYLDCYLARSSSKVKSIAAACFKDSLSEWLVGRQGSLPRSHTLQTLLSHLNLSNDIAAAEDEEEGNDIEVADDVYKKFNSVDVADDGQVYIEMYRDSSQGVRAPVQAALTQMLTNFVETLKEIEDTTVEDGDDVLADFKSTGQSGSADGVIEEVVALLKFITNKIENVQSSNQGRQVLSLLLEGIHAILSKVAGVIRHNAQFQELVWKSLCPTLISLLGSPKTEKSSLTQRGMLMDELGRGSGCSSSAPGLVGPGAKVIYSIAAELVRLVGGVRSLRPVLEALFHRMLLYPPPHHRLDALRVIKELLNNPERLVDMVTPLHAASNGNNKTDAVDVGLIKIIVDGVQECCHCNDSRVCFTSVTCVSSLLDSLEKISRGQAISDVQLENIQKVIVDGVQECCHCNDSRVCFTSVTCVSSLLDSLEKISRGQAISDVQLENIQKVCVEAEKNLAQGDKTYSVNIHDDDGGSVKNETRIPHPFNHSTSLETPPDSPRPIVDSDTNSEASSQDLFTTKRITCLKYTDLEIENKNRSAENGIDEKVEGDADLELRACTAGSDIHLSSMPMDHKESSQEMEKDFSTNANQSLEHEHLSKGTKYQHDILNEQLKAVERENAAAFVQQLYNIAADLSSMLSITDVDEALQNFASNFCASLSQQQYSGTSVHSMRETPTVVLNADGVYTASVATLQLSYKLYLAGYYDNKQLHCASLTESKFVDGVLSTGLLLFLSPTWLCEVYAQTQATPILNFSKLSTSLSPLLQLLEDLDGLNSHEIGGQLLFEYHESSSWNSITQAPGSQEKLKAGKLVAQHILRSCWDGLLDVLSVCLNGKSSCGISFSLGLLLGMEGAKEETQRARDAICISLSGLQTTSRLCCTLGLQSKCSSAFAQLANSSCVHEDLHAQSIGPSDSKGMLKAAVLREKPKLVRLHAAHVLSMDVVMTTGLEVGSHAADCWKHVFRCCAHISELEHTYFSQGNHQSSLPRVHQGQTADVDGIGEPEVSCETELFDIPVVTAAVPVAPRINVAELIRQSSMESGWETSLTGGGVLTPAQAAKALCGLSQSVDSLFEDAARKMNLQALLSFLSELAEASRHQLIRLQYLHEEAIDTSDLSPLMTTSNHMVSTALGSRLPTNALHLYRLQEVLMTVVHSSRPLLHLVRVWACVSPYLVQATGHRDRNISKMAVTCIHDFIVAMLSSHPELPHFHVNEFLCKTFEDMLCLELCDSDVQDQIVCSICELVEACTRELQSGWRPLFGALRSVRIEFTANEEVNEARQRHVAAVLDVFEVYLSTDNILVFANATVDCILCLLKYVHGPGIFEDIYDDDDDDSGSDMVGMGMNCENLCIPALGYLTRCCQILASLWKMPACPTFKGAFRIQMGSSVSTVDAAIPHLDVDPVLLDSMPSFLQSSRVHLIPEEAVGKGDNRTDSQSITSVDSGMLDGASDNRSSIMIDNKQENTTESSSPGISFPSLSELDKSSGVLHVWFLLLDGLATSIASCPRSFQPQTLTTLFDLLRSTAQVPGRPFALFCVNHLLLPMLQSWLRRGANISSYWDAGAVNFKQCCGLTADLVVEFVVKFVDETESIPVLELMLKQLFAVLIECVAQPVENLSRLGCSCIRHVLLSSGPVLTESMWNISTQCLARAAAVTTFRLRQLMALFHPNSDNFYGDIGQVKVATRKDCVALDTVRLKQLAQQVFLLDSQMNPMPQIQYNMDEDKSFVFLLYSHEHEDSINPEHIFARVPFRDMVVGLLSSQLLLQTLDCLLLDCGGDGKHFDDITVASMPGLLQYMSTRNILLFLEILDSFCQLSLDFDSRPGLKFLLQKVAGLEVAANLYRQAGASMVLYLHALIHLCAHLHDLNIHQVQQVLEQQTEVTTQTNEHRTNDASHSQPNNTNLSVELSCGEVVDGEKEPSSLTCVGISLDDPTPATIQTASETEVQETKSSFETVPAGDSIISHDSVNQGESVTSVVVTKLSSGDSLDPKSVLCEPHIQKVHRNKTAASLPAWKLLGIQKTTKPWLSADIFLPLLRQKCDAICNHYIDILAENEDESLVDRMANRPLFLLIAQPDDISELTRPHKRKDANAKVKQNSGSKGSEEEIFALENVMTKAEKQQDSESDVESKHEGSEKKNFDEKDNKDEENSWPQYSKRQQRADHESKVYSVATEKVIQNLIGQYKRRKMQNTMPSTITKFAQRHQKSESKVPRREQVDEAVDKQQKSSIMKDSEARHRSWSEMLTTVLQLFLQLPEQQFQALLPATFTCINKLICHAQDPVLRDTLAQWFQRIGFVYSFSPIVQSVFVKPTTPEP